MVRCYIEPYNQCFFIFSKSEPSYKKREPEVDEKELEKVGNLHINFEFLFSNISCVETLRILYQRY